MVLSRCFYNLRKHFSNSSVIWMCLILNRWGTAFSLSFQLQIKFENQNFSTLNQVWQSALRFGAANAEKWYSTLRDFWISCLPPKNQILVCSDPFLQIIWNLECIQMHHYITSKIHLWISRLIWSLFLRLSRLSLHFSLVISTKLSIKIHFCWLL